MTWNAARENFTGEISMSYGESEAAAIFDLVFEKITGLGKAAFAGKKNQGVTNDTLLQLNTIISRLKAFEPIQYILHESWFCGLKFYVDENVLIPRPETEELVEWVIANCKFPVDELSILDVGTGSGCIPVTLKRRLRKANVTAIDISAAALAVAKKNAVELGANVNFMEMDILDVNARAKLGTFDIITSNPPYIPEKDKTMLDRHVAEREPATALFVPSNDPLLFYKALAAFGKQHLNNGGSIYVEMHADYARGVEELFNKGNFDTELKKDLQGKDRMLRATRKIN